MIRALNGISVLMSAAIFLVTATFSGVLFHEVVQFWSAIIVVTVWAGFAMISTGQHRDMPPLYTNWHARLAAACLVGGWFIGLLVAQWLVVR